MLGFFTLVEVSVLSLVLQLQRHKHQKSDQGCKTVHVSSGDSIPRFSGGHQSDPAPHPGQDDRVL